MQGTPGYIVVSATNSQDVEYVDSYNIKYQPNAYIFSDLTFHTRYTAALFTGVDELTEEQAKRFISRIDIPRKNWKISESDIAEREYWDEYQEAFEDVINTTATKDSPWYVVPADRKWYARLIVSRIVLETLREVDPQFPVVSDEDMERIEKYRESLPPKDVVCIGIPITGIGKIAAHIPGK